VGRDSAESGLIELREYNFDGVIIDLILPGMSGLDFLSENEIRKAVIMSGKISSTVGNGLCRRYTYLSKPFTCKDLMKSLSIAKIL